MLQNIFWVFVGGGLGSLLRYGLAVVWQATWGATLLANLLACLLLGYGLGKGWGGWQLQLWAIGFCGGLSTFSTWIKELYQGFGKDGNIWITMLYLWLSVSLGCLALALGLWWGRQS